MQLHACRPVLFHSPHTWAYPNSTASCRMALACSSPGRHLIHHTAGQPPSLHPLKPLLKEGLLLCVCVCGPTCVVELLFEQQQSHVLPVTIMHNALGLGDVKRKPVGSSSKAMSTVKHPQPPPCLHATQSGCWVLTNTSSCRPQQWLSTAAVTPAAAAAALTAGWMTKIQTQVSTGLLRFPPRTLWLFVTACKHVVLIVLLRGLL